MKRRLVDALTLVAVTTGGLTTAGPAVAQEPGTTTRLGSLRTGLVTDAGLFFHVVRSSGAPGLYVLDPRTGVDQPVSPASTGGAIELGDVSPDGRYVHYTQVLEEPRREISYLLDRTTGERERTSWTVGGKKGFGEAGAISDDGRVVAFDMFTRNMRTGRVQRVDIGVSGEPRQRVSRELDLSGNGRYVTFSGYPKGADRPGSDAAWQIWRHDRRTGRTELVTTARGGGLSDGPSRDAAMSTGGRYVAFFSYASDLTRPHARVGLYLRDMKTGRTRLVSRTPEGRPFYVNHGTRAKRGDGVFLSGDARTLVFRTTTALVPEDTNVAMDAYALTLDGSGAVSLLNVSSAGAAGNRGSVPLALSANGRFVVIVSDDPGLDPVDPAPPALPGSPAQLYLRDRGAQG